jgi:hypothetical protein
MKKTPVFGFGAFLGAFLFAALPGVSGLDLTLTGGTGNVSFDPEEESAIDDGTFSGSQYWLGRLEAEQSVSGPVSIRGTLERDPILRNQVSLEAAVQGNSFSFHAGPFAGIYNSGVPVMGGIRAGFGLYFPGIVFITADGGATLSALGIEGDYESYVIEGAVGFWLPHVVNTVSGGLKRYLEQKSGGLSIRDELLRFRYCADIYGKTLPCVIQASFGYEKLSRSYDRPASFEEDRYHIVFAGAEITWKLWPGLSLILGGELPVYSWGESPLGNADPFTLYQAHAGIRINL